MWEVDIHIKVTKPKLWRVVLDGVSGFQLVHSMLLGEHDNLPLGLAHDGCALCLSFGVCAFWIYAGIKPWRRPPDCKVFFSWVHMPAHCFGLRFLMWPYFSSPFLLVFVGAER